VDTGLNKDPSIRKAESRAIYRCADRKAERNISTVKEAKVIGLG
jgi:hypothetical protein